MKKIIVTLLFAASFAACKNESIEPNTLTRCIPVDVKIPTGVKVYKSPEKGISAVTYEGVLYWADNESVAQQMRDKDLKGMVLVTSCQAVKDVK